MSNPETPKTASDLVVSASACVVEEVVREFIRERHEYVLAARGSANADADYFRWQGHMEARRQLAQKLGLPYEFDRATGGQADV